MYSPVQGLWPAPRWPLGSELSGHPGSLGLTGPGALALACGDSHRFVCVKLITAGHALYTL